MRASSEDMTGNVGETEVAAKFERLGWGVAPNPKHDLGTDLWLMARDARLFDLGLVVGAQVKTGPTWFQEQCRDASGELVGWWFRDSDRRHVDAWLAHGLPHLIVLHDLVSGTSYWAHVTDAAVVGTGKGAKILVPAGSTIDEVHRDDLLRVAASKKSAGAWEGSAWTGAAAVAPSALLRHALIVPRLIAPHPNAGHASSVSPAQALALLVQARLVDLAERSEEHPAVPSMHEAGESTDWDWRLVAAMNERVTAGDHRALAAAAMDAPDAPRRAAAAVATAATMLEDGHADDALAVLDGALGHDDAEPVDQAWLNVQKARACAEVGRVAEARDLAARAQAVGATHAEDVTATAVAGVAAQILFSTSGWGEADVASVIAGADTTASWWRTQTVSRALTAITDRTFWEWSRDTTVRLTSGDVANDQLLSAALTASYVGDHATWRHLSGLLGQDGLLRLGRAADPDDAARALDTLRLAGSDEGIKHAVRRLADDGPAAAVSVVVARVDLGLATRTTGPTGLTLLQYGGDLLEVTAADTNLRWLLAAIVDPAAFVERTTPSYRVVDRLVETLAGVVPSGSPEAQRLVAEHIADLPPQDDQSRATSWARAAFALPDSAWTEATAGRAGRTTDGHHLSLRTPMRGVASRYDAEVRQRLLGEAEAGSLDALGALGDVRRLPEDVVRVLVNALAGHVRRQLEEAAAGSFGMGGHDYGRTLALLNVWHPAVADWQPLVELIRDPRVVGGHKAGALRFLAGLADRVPAGARDGLVSAARAAAAQQPPLFRDLFGEARDSGGPAAELVAALGGDCEEAGQLPELLAGDSDARVSAARIASRSRQPEHVGALLVLASDADPTVRTAAARGLATVVADGDGGAVALAAVRRCADDPGRCVPQAVASALSAKADLPPDAAAVLGLLRDHRSAAVRRAAEEPASS